MYKNRFKLNTQYKYTTVIPLVTQVDQHSHLAVGQKLMGSEDLNLIQLNSQYEAGRFKERF